MTLPAGTEETIVEPNKGEWCEITARTADVSLNKFGDLRLIDASSLTPTDITSAPPLLAKTVLGQTVFVEPGSRQTFQGTGLEQTVFSTGSSPLYAHVELSQCAAFCACSQVYFNSTETDQPVATQTQLAQRLLAKRTRVELARTFAEEFERAKEETFEDGMGSDFGLHLAKLVKDHGHSALAIVRSLLFVTDVDAEVGGEALRVLGRIDDPPTYSNRLILLEQCLIHPQLRVRDGAILGLARFDNPSAIVHLRKAVETEPNPTLREDMNQVLEQLKDTLRCLSS